MAASPVHDLPIPVRLKLSALWASVMFCYIYADYFELYVPGKLAGMLDGQMALGAVTQQMLMATALLMAIPSLMVFLSLALPPRASRWINIPVGAFYALVMTMIVLGGAWAFYMFFAAVEIVLTLMIVGYAWKWPAPTDVARR